MTSGAPIQNFQNYTICSTEDEKRKGKGSSVQHMIDIWEVNVTKCFVQLTYYSHRYSHRFYNPKEKVKMGKCKEKWERVCFISGLDKYEIDNNCDWIDFWCYSVKDIERIFKIATTIREKQIKWDWDKEWYTMFFNKEIK